MTLTELPEWLGWRLIGLALLVWFGVAIVVALGIAGAAGLHKRPPRPARRKSPRDSAEAALVAAGIEELDRIARERAARRAVRAREAREMDDRARLALARVPAQRAPERGRRRPLCAPGRPCGLHHPTICVASACCDRYCPTADPEQAS